MKSVMGLQDFVTVLLFAVLFPVQSIKSDYDQQDDKEKERWVNELPLIPQS